MVEPVYPTYNRPQFDIAPVIDTANRFALQQKEMTAADQLASLRGLQIDKEKAMSPLEIAAAQRGDRMGALQEEDATAQAGALRDYRRGAASGDPGAADALNGYPELKLRVTGALDQIGAAGRDKLYRRTQATAAVTDYVMKHGGDVGALDAAEKTLVGLGATPEEAAAWRASMSNPFTADRTASDIMATSKIMNDYALGAKAGSSYATATPELRMKIDAEASRQVNGEIQAEQRDNPLAKFPAEEIAARKAAARAKIIEDMYPGTTYGSTVADKAKYETKIAPPTTKEEKAVTEAASKPAETGPKSRGPVPVEAAPQDERNWWERNAPEVLGGKTVERYTGAAADEKAMRKWWNELDDAATVANPGYDPGLPEGPANPQFLTKHSNFK